MNKIIIFALAFVMAILSCSLVYSHDLNSTEYSHFTRVSIQPDSLQIKYSVYIPESHINKMIKKLSKSKDAVSELEKQIADEVAQGFRVVLNDIPQKMNLLKKHLDTSDHHGHDQWVLNINIAIPIELPPDQKSKLIISNTNFREWNSLYKNQLEAEGVVISQSSIPENMSWVRDNKHRDINIELFPEINKEFPIIYIILGLGIIAFIALMMLIKRRKQ
ncbi:MAG: hypothetical protein ABIE74_03110 [Pseudomonadota bacterium]